jgi:signal transduction histidine kinase
MRDALVTPGKPLSTRLAAPCASRAASSADRPTAGLADVGTARYLRLRLATVVAPVAFLAVIDYLRHTLFTDWLHTLPGTLAIGVLLAGAAALFSNAVFGMLARLQGTVLLQSQRMAALEEHDRLAREINDGFLQRIYGVGLSLQTCLLSDELPPATARALERAIGELDSTIGAMREYLMQPPDPAERGPGR